MAHRLTRTLVFRKGDFRDVFQRCPRGGPAGAAGRCAPQHRRDPGRGHRLPSARPRNEHRRYRGAAGVGRITLYGHFKTRAELVDAVMARTIEHADAVLDATDTGGDPADALARLVAASWQIVHQFRNILLAAQRELPAERIRGVHDPLLRRVHSLIERGQRAGTFRTDLPEQWLITTAFSLMHAAAEDATAGRLQADDAARLITATLLAAFTPPVESRQP